MTLPVFIAQYEHLNWCSVSRRGHKERRLTSCSFHTHLHFLCALHREQQPHSQQQTDQSQDVEEGQHSVGGQHGRPGREPLLFEGRVVRPPSQRPRFGLRFDHDRKEPRNLLHSQTLAVSLPVLVCFVFSNITAKAPSAHTPTQLSLTGDFPSRSCGVRLLWPVTY